MKNEEKKQLKIDLLYLLLSNNIFPINIKEENKNLEILDKSKNPKKLMFFGTILSNLAYYGFAPNKNVIMYLKNLDNNELSSLWKEIEPILKQIKGLDVDLKSAMVYKNFPKETLSMEDALYWTNQILIYSGVPVEEVLGEQVDLPREKLTEKARLKILTEQTSNSFDKIFNDLLAKPVSFTELEKKNISTLLLNLPAPVLDISKVKFKENAIILAGKLLKEKKGNVVVSNATDTLRIAHYLSGGAGDLKEKVKFQSFSRNIRKKLLDMLENSNNLKEDIAARADFFKKFLHNLHVGDFKNEYPKVIEAQNLLYNNQLHSFKSLVDKGFKNKDEQVFILLKSRPGEFLRRWHESYNIFGIKAVDNLKQVLSKLDNYQLLKFKKYIETINYRDNLLIAPKGKWNKIQIIENKKKISEEDEKNLISFIEKIIADNLNKQFPQGITLDENLSKVKLPTAGQELESFGRGTVFNMPENTKFIRSASYWEAPTEAYNVWFDNGWNFFDNNNQSLGTICWNSHFDGALFSGDPATIGNLKGAGCQVIDLDLAKLEQNNVKYAIWNILGYSNMSFDQVKTVRGLLQYGENSLEGEVFEPSRIHQAFELKGNGLTKYVCILDVRKKSLIYLDGNLKANVSSASANGKYLEKILPDLLDYLETIPSVYDLLKDVKFGPFKILRSDKDIDIQDTKAYVFEPENKNNTYENISINKILTGEIFEDNINNNITENNNNMNKKKLI